jgi:hypothetical protein
MKRRRTAQEQKLVDDARLLRAWKNFHREELNAALAGPHGPMLERLVFILKTLAPGSASLLLAYIRGVDWQLVDYSTRLVALHQVNDAITRLRERAGLEPIDDGIPGERDNAYRCIKAILVPHRTVAPPGAQPGLSTATSYEELQHE